MRDDGYHFDCRFKKGKEKEGVNLFAGLLEIEPPNGRKNWVNGDHNIWNDEGGWDGRPAILKMSDGTMIAGTLVPFPHSGTPGKFNPKGHFDFYLKDSKGNDKINKKTGISYVESYQIMAGFAAIIARQMARSLASD